MKTASYISKHPALYVGIFTSMALIAYFMIMRAIGLVHVMELRLFNFLILLAGITWVMREHAKLTEKHYNYFQTLGKGLMTVLIAVGIFSVFIFCYLSIDTQMLYMMKQNSLMGNFLTPYTGALGVFGEGTSSGFFMSYILLSYIKNQRQTT
jgi:hypothetical protein